MVAGTSRRIWRNDGIKCGASATPRASAARGSRVTVPAYPLKCVDEIWWMPQGILAGSQPVPRSFLPNSAHHSRLPPMPLWLDYDFRPSVANGRKSVFRNHNTVAGPQRFIWRLTRSVGPQPQSIPASHHKRPDPGCPRNPANRACGIPRGGPRPRLGASAAGKFAAQEPDPKQP
jgi:hypothetical protein